jgi:hypothetical protein
MKQDIQSVFFERVKQRANPNFSLVDEIADLLQISNDSAYRRLRGETAITLEEATILSKHFGVSLEEISPGKSDTVLFGRSTFRDQPLEFDEYLLKTAEYLQRIADTKEKHGIYAAKDIPVFHHFQVPEMGMFKLFFWLKTIRGNQAIDAVKFDFNIIPAELMKKSKALAKIYFQIPFTEIWNEDTSNAALRQIEYFYEAGWLANKSVAVKLCDKAEEMFNIIHKQAETGMKLFDGKQVHPDVRYELYYNDLVGLDNSIFVETDQFPVSMIGYNELDYLFTSHPGFCREVQSFLNKQIGKSMLLSGSSERERNKFFKRIYEKITALKAKIEAS